MSHSPIKIIQRSDLIIKDRQRKKITTPELNELKESILTRGLLQPPVAFELGDGKYLLTVGERRTRAIDLIHKENKFFQCNTQTIAIGELPVLLTDLDTDLQRREAELDENIIREDLTWQERAQALADIHNLRKSQNPTQTFKKTSEEITKKSGANTNRLQTTIRESTIIAEHLDDPAIANARSAAEAHTLILRKEENKALAALARRQQSRMVNPDLIVRQGDLLEIMPILDPDQFDLILGDPPYGIGADSGGFRDRTVVHHNYDDDIDTSRTLQQCILTEGFRLTKPRANIFMFTDIAHWEWLQRVSAQIGWTPFRRPLIWGKSDSEGLAPWGTSGPRLTTEFIFYATKGRKGLLASPIDYQRVNRVPRNERIHAAEKPVELLRKLIECSTLPGDKILDPLCGSGSTLIAAKETQRRAVGIEKDPSYYETAMANVHGEKK